MVDKEHLEERAKATLEQAKGTFKEAAGEILGNPALAAEGQAERQFGDELKHPEKRPDRLGEGLTARDVMTPDVRCVRSSATVVDAARILAEANVGSLPICGEDHRLKGMLTDRDIVTKVVAQGLNPLSVHVSEIAQGEIVTVDADTSLGELMHTMAEHQIRRVPVISDHQLVGIVAQADIARCLDNPSVGELLDALSVP